MQELLDLVDSVPDFPKPGILFRDLSRLLKTDFVGSIDALSALYTKDEWSKIDIVAAIESRGFIFGAALADRHGKGLGLIRKEGKLPNIAAQRAFHLEYGSAILEMQAAKGRCLIVDDVLATGGTLRAAAELCAEAGLEVTHIAAFANLAMLNDFHWQGITPRAVLVYK